MLKIITLIVLTYIAGAVKIVGAKLFASCVAGKFALVFTPSAVVDQLRNKLGNVVFSTGANGPYVRKRVSPSQPVSTYSSDVRARLATIAIAWKGLSASVIAGFNSLAASMSKTNVLGQKTPRTGIAVWQYLNNNLLNCGESMLTAVPTLTGVVEPSFVSLVAANTGNTSTLTFDGALGTDTKALIFASPGVPVSRQLVKSQLRQIKVAATADTAAIALHTAYIAKYPAGLPVGQKLYVAYKMVNTVTGEAGKLVIKSCTIGA